MKKTAAPEAPERLLFCARQWKKPDELKGSSSFFLAE